MSLPGAQPRDPGPPRVPADPASLRSAVLPACEPSTTPWRRGCSQGSPVSRDLVGALDGRAEIPLLRETRIRTPGGPGQHGPKRRIGSGRLAPTGWDQERPGNRRRCRAGSECQRLVQPAAQPAPRRVPALHP